jgi:hypothetical protein
VHHNQRCFYVFAHRKRRAQEATIVTGPSLAKSEGPSRGS